MINPMFRKAILWHYVVVILLVLPITSRASHLFHNDNTSTKNTNHISTSIHDSLNTDTDSVYEYKYYQQTLSSKLEGISNLTLSNTLDVNKGSMIPAFCSNYNELHDAELRLKLSVLDNNNEYISGVKTDFRVYVKLRINLLSPGNPTLSIETDFMQVIVDVTKQLFIPEKVNSFKFSNILNSTNFARYKLSDQIHIEILESFASTLPPDVASNIKLQADIIENYALSPGTNFKYIPVRSNPIISGNPVRISWKKDESVSCNDEYHEFQIQILKLYNTNAEYTNKYQVNSIIDWDEALTIESGDVKYVNGTYSYDLTLAEGTGYYVWRVRPIGNYFMGGFTDSRNWGEWSCAPDNGTVLNWNNNSSNVISFLNPPITQNSTCLDLRKYAFFYNQFDENINWTYNRGFADNGKISETMQYATPSGLPRQAQARQQSSENVIVTQSIQDYNGRTTVATLPVPVVRDINSRNYYFGFVFNAVRNSIGGIYSAIDIDGEKSGNPNSTNGGLLGSYYNSSMQPGHERIPDAQGYAFSQTRYIPDGSNRVEEVSGAGNVHRMGSTTSGTTRTVKTLYSSPTDQELVTMFGDEAPNPLSVQKKLLIDQNKTVSIQYVSGGKVLATCLEDNSVVTDPILENINESEQLDLTVTDKINIPAQNSDGIRTQKRYAFSKPTNITVASSFTPGLISLDGQQCYNICTTCDYKIEIRIHNLEYPDDPLKNFSSLYHMPSQLKDLKANPNDICTTSTYQPAIITMMVPEGTYIIDRIVSIDVETGWKSIKEKITDTYQSKVNEIYQNQSAWKIEPTQKTLSDAFVELNDKGVEEFYMYLGIGSISELQTRANNKEMLNLSFTKTGESCPVMVSIPILYEDCAKSHNEKFNNLGESDFEALLYGGKFYAGDGTNLGLNDFFWHPYNGSTVNTYVLVNGMTNPVRGKFNQMIKNMVNATVGGKHIYTKKELWECWENIVITLKNVMFKPGTTDRNPDFDLLQTFLECTDRHFQYPYYSDHPYDNGTTEGYLDHAYKLIQFQSNDEQCTSCITTIDNTVSPVTMQQCQSVWIDNTTTKKSHYWEKLEQCLRANRTHRLSDVPDGDIKQWGEDFLNNTDTKHCLMRDWYNGQPNVKGHIDNNTGQWVESETSGIVSIDQNTGQIQDGFWRDCDKIAECGVLTNPRNKLVEICTTSCKDRHPSFMIEAERALHEANPNQLVDGGQVQCLASNLLNECINSCALTITCTANAQFPTFGTEEQQEKYQKVMSSNPKLTIIQQSENCGNGKTKFNEYSINYSYVMVQVLNSALELQRQKIGIQGGMWNFKQTLLDANIPQSILSQIPNFEVPIFKDIQTYFKEYTLQGQPCKLTYYINGMVYQNHPMVNDLNQMIDGFNNVTFTQDMLSKFTGSILFGSNRFADFDNTNRSSICSTYIHRITEITNSSLSKYYNSLFNPFLTKRQLHVNGNFFNSTPISNYLYLFSDPVYVNKSSHLYETNGTYHPANLKLYLGVNPYYFDLESYFHITSYSNNVYGGVVCDNGYHNVYLDLKNDFYVNCNWCTKVNPFPDQVTSGIFPDWFKTDNVNNDKTQYDNIYQYFNGLDNFNYPCDLRRIKFREDNDGYLIAYFPATTFQQVDYPLREYRLNFIRFAIPQQEIEILNQSGGCTFTCPAACLEWVSRENSVVENLEDDKKLDHVPNYCFAVPNLKKAVDEVFRQYVKDKVEEVKPTYTSACSSLGNVDASFTVQYPIQYKHFTLYYYDRAGQLIRTIPPKGVHFTTTDRSTATSHTMATYYKYNSLGLPTVKISPDELRMTTTFYNSALQPRATFTPGVSYNATGPVTFNGKYLYTKYDKLGRTIESGVSDLTALPTPSIGLFEPLQLSDLDNKSFPSAGSEKTYVFYSIGGGAYLNKYSIPENQQNNIRNRISKTVHNGTEAIYSYDPHGNITWIRHSLTGMNRPFTETGNFVKYEYEILSGTRTKILYNEGRSDQFYHTYEYDADNRMVAVNTSRDNEIWERDAKYTYFDYGPLQRRELGQDRIQGMDYTYTLQGWFKALNHPDSPDNPQMDPGLDAGGLVGMPNHRVGKDVFASMLHYYNGDFTKGNFAGHPEYTAQWLNTTVPLPSLYNGNIRAISSNYSNVTGQFGNDAQGVFRDKILESYRYDRLERVLTSWSFEAGIGNAPWNLITDYSTTYQYDENGNFTDLQRWNGRLDDPAIGLIDNFAYNYLPGTNKLTHVVDGVPTTPYTGDLETQALGNYSYDCEGRMVLDKSMMADLTRAMPSAGYNLKWNAQGKLDMQYQNWIDNAGVRWEATTVYHYDALGNRIHEIRVEENYTDLLYNANATRSCSNTRKKQETKEIWYAYDEANTLLAVYKQDQCKSLDPEAYGMPPTKDPLSITDWYIYGLKREGSAQPGITYNETQSTLYTDDASKVIGIVPSTISFNRQVNYKRYEIADYQGNVRATITDVKEMDDANSYQTTTFTATLANWQSFYPFGMEHPMRGDDGYRFAYQGMLKDNGFASQGNHYTTLFRQYDPRIGRWMSLDPKVSHNVSPYVAFNDNCILFSDPLGDTLELTGTQEEIQWIKQKREVSAGVKLITKEVKEKFNNNKKSSDQKVAPKTRTIVTGFTTTPENAQLYREAQDDLTTLIKAPELYKDVIVQDDPNIIEDVERYGGAFFDPETRTMYWSIHFKTTQYEWRKFSDGSGEWYAPMDAKTNTWPGGGDPYFGVNGVITNTTPRYYSPDPNSSYPKVTVILPSMAFRHETAHAARHARKEGIFDLKFNRNGTSIDIQRDIEEKAVIERCNRLESRLGIVPRQYPAYKQALPNINVWR